VPGFFLCDIESMSAINWFKENRLKVASIVAVTGDFMMGLAGGSHMFAHKEWTSWKDFFLVASGCVFIIAHAGLLLWAKGGKAPNNQKHHTVMKEVPIYIKPFIPWRYPLDYGFVLFATGGFLIFFSGMLSANMNVVITGACISCASLTGWLWPANKPLFGRNLLQITAILYAVSSLNAIMGGYITQNAFMIGAGCLWLVCNIIYATVRKENQSSFTQSQQNAK
jgi:hypothetical protein